MLRHKQERAGFHPVPALQFAASLFFLFLCEVAAHGALLRLPYYWDEAGYYIPAAYDFFRTGTPVPFSTLSNAHPPGLSLYLALAWKLFGFSPPVTRVAMCFLTALALSAVFRLARGCLRSNFAAAAAVLLTATYPVWFAQSTLAHADMAAAAATLWGLSFAWEAGGRAPLRATVICFTLAALCKEVAIGTPLALGGWELWLLLRKRRRATEEGSWARLGALCFPALPLAVWFGYHRWRTGFTFGNPEYLRYNAMATLTPERVLLAFAHRALHLSAHLNLFVPVALALGSLLLPPLVGRTQIPARLRAPIWVVIVANAGLFSFLGGALLTRYLLPMYPLILLLAVGAVYARFRRWLWYPALGVAAFLAGLLLPPPYRVAPEDTLAYRDAIVLEEHAIALVEKQYPHGTVLTAWPVTDGLTKPELGYTQKPLPVAAIDNFSLVALQKLVAAPPSYATAIVFSTKYEPPGLRFRPWDEQEERYFDLHHDLSATAVATLLHGTVVWREERGGQWAAVLRFEHPQLAEMRGFYNHQ